jgi:hypothetical protein
MIVNPLIWMTLPVTKTSRLINQNDEIYSIICGSESQLLMYLHHL